ncbi:MAG TPA: hypothetical protein VIK28_04420, partial [Sedimentisphaerales bacterium]
PGALLFTRKSNLPDWIDNFCVDTELDAINITNALEEEILALRAKIVEKQSDIARARELKALFSGTGDEFKDTVAAALQELGLNCVDGPHPRADILASNGKRFMAIEAKGLDGNAKESNFRQVERWKAEVNSAVTIATEERKADPDLRRYGEQLDLLGMPPNVTDDCKGLMVIGTFRSTPLTDRKGPDFPDGVIRRLGHSDVCALTGLQLFGLVMHVRKNPHLKSEIVESLFNTAGVLDRATEWNEFIQARRAE